MLINFYDFYVNNENYITEVIKGVTKEEFINQLVEDLDTNDIEVKEDFKEEIEKSINTGLFVEDRTVLYVYDESKQSGLVIVEHL